MEKKEIKNVYIKMIAAILLPTVIVFGSMSVMTVIDHKKALMGSMKSKTDAIIKLLEKISISSYQNFEYIMLDEFAAGASEDPEITYVSFLDKNGHLLTKDLDEGRSDEGSVLRFEKKILEFENDPESLLGFIRIGFSTQTMQASLREEVFTMVLYSIIGFVFFSISTVFLTSKLIKQLKNALDTTGTILETLPFGMVVVRKDKRIQTVNKAAMDIMGIENEHDLIGKVCHDKICPAENCNCPVLDLGQEFDSSERMVLDKDGGKIPVMKSVIQIDLDGEEVLLEVFADISPLKEAEKAIAESEKKLRTVMEACADPIVVYDRDGLATYINPAFERVFGWRADELLGNRIDFVPEKAQAETMEALGKILKGQTCYAMETIRTTKDNRQIDIRLSASPIMDEADSYNGMVVNLQDVTDLVASRKEAEKANKAKSEFLANMSHEIRTPMNGIIGMTDLVLGTDLTKGQRNHLEMVKMSADSLMTVINDILDFSKIESGKMEMGAIDFNLRVALENAADTLATKAHEKGLELTCHIRPDVPTALIGDPGRLRQIIINLVGNSIKFTEEGEIVIRIEMESKTEDSVKLHFMVSDTGIGIPPDKLDSIFTSFEQVDGSTTRKYGGTGLGLSISKQIVEMMGGEMHVESPNSFRSEEDSISGNQKSHMGGPGSIFHFTIGLDLSRSQDVRLQRPKPQNLSGMPVLIVDDNYSNRILLQEMVASWGLVPTVTADGKEALACFKQAFDSGMPHRLILLDIQMPELDGFDVAKLIKDDPSGEDVKIILLSSIGQRGDSDRCKEFGISGYLPKPIKQSDLFDAIMMTMGLRSEEMSTVITRHKIYEARESLNILLAEDNLVNQTLVINLLETRGHRVTLASNGREAVEAFNKGDFDLILMDIQMPEMGGFEATSEIRNLESDSADAFINRSGLGNGKSSDTKNSKIKSIPIVAMTAHALKGDREKCLEAGMDDYVSKPIKPEALFSVIHKVTRQLESEKEQQTKTSQGSKPISPKTFDLSRAMETMLGDEDLFQEIAGMFLKQCSDSIAEIRKAVAENDAGGLERAAHSLKGSVGNFGADKAHEAAYRLERLGNEGKMETAEEDLSKLEKIVNKLTAEMKVVLQEMKK